MEPKNRQKTLFIVVIVIAVLLVGNKVVVDPLWAAWERGGEEVAALKKTYNEGSQLLKSKKSVLAKWQKMKAAATPADRTSEENKILAAYDKWEKASRIKPERTMHQWRDGDDQQYVTFEFSADVSGTMQQIESFLYAVERDLAELALKVEGVKISARGDDGLQLSLSLQLSGLVLGQPSASN